MKSIGIIDADYLGSKTSFPNLALMKISAYNKEQGNNVSLLQSYDDISNYDLVYIGKVFDYTDVPSNILHLQNVVYGGTGFYFDKAQFLPNDIEHIKPDYMLYSDQRKNYTDYSIGFTTRGCIRKCSFCVNRNYSEVLRWSPVSEFLDQGRKYICLLDDNILAYSRWNEVIDELEGTGKRYQFKQGIDIRLLTDEKAKVLSSARLHGEVFFAFDDYKDRELIESKMKLWNRYRSRETRAYLLCGYKSTNEQDIIELLERVKICIRYRIVPYIMRYKNYKDSRWHGVYTTIAGWCNVPAFFRKKSLEEFGEVKQSCKRYLSEFKREYPEIAARYYRMRWL